MPRLKGYSRRGFHIYVNFNEGRRAHVHVTLGGREVLVWLDDLTIKRKRGVNSTEAEELRKWVQSLKYECREHWNKYHQDKKIELED
ncbi:MAG: DUF4160 domain-containing protein [Kiritimatiellales bacterium]|nr:DUF4160 domain-containing protein [Kiritimatiellales bacterium]